MLSDNSQVNSYFYGGDKDTRKIAMENILEKYELPSFASHTNEDLETFHDKYSDEIYKEMTRLVELGKQEGARIDIAWDYIKEMYKHYTCKDLDVNTEPQSNNNDVEDELPF